MANKKRSQRRHQSGNPARRAAGVRPASATTATAAPSAFRSTLNRVSAQPLIWMHRLPRWLIPVVMGLSLAAGLFLTDGWAWLGVGLLAFVALFVIWLYALSWPVLTPGGRLGRGLVAVALLGLTVLKAIGRL